MTKVYLIYFYNEADGNVQIGVVCATEEIATRELKKVRDSEMISNWRKCWNYLETEVIDK